MSACLAAAGNAALERTLLHPLLAYLRVELGACDWAEPPTPLAAGNETRVYAFRLNGLAAPLDRPLVLRLFRPGDDPARAVAEAALQNAVTEQCFPAARAWAVCSRTDVLGAPFFVMERLPGQPLYGDSIELDASGQPRSSWRDVLRSGARKLVELPRALAAVDLRIHALDTPKLIAALERARLAWGRRTLTGCLGEISEGVERCRLDGLRAGVAWLEAHLPAPGGELVLCHGDMQPLNLLVRGKQVVGVVDWSNALFAPAECEIGWTRATFRTLPLPLPGPLRLAERAVGAAIANGYSNAYRRQRDFDRSQVPYHEAFHSLRVLYGLGERAARGADLRDVWNSPRAIRKLGAHFHAITGTRISIRALG